MKIGTITCVDGKQLNLIGTSKDYPLLRPIAKAFEKLSESKVCSIKWIDYRKET